MKLGNSICTQFSCFRDFEKPIIYFPLFFRLFSAVYGPFDILFIKYNITTPAPIQFSLVYTHAGMMFSFPGTISISNTHTDSTHCMFLYFINQFNIFKITCFTFKQFHICNQIEFWQVNDLNCCFQSMSKQVNIFSYIYLFFNHLIVIFQK